MEEKELKNQTIYFAFFESVKLLLGKAKQEGAIKIDFFSENSESSRNEEDFDNQPESLILRKSLSSTHIPEKIEIVDSIEKKLKKYNLKTKIKILEEENLDLKKRVENTEERKESIEKLFALSDNINLIQLQNHLLQKEEKIKELEKKIEELKENSQLLKIYIEKNEVLSEIVNNLSKKLVFYFSFIFILFHLFYFIFHLMYCIVFYFYLFLFIYLLFIFYFLGNFSLFGEFFSNFI